MPRLPEAGLLVCVLSLVLNGGVASAQEPSPSSDPVGIGGRVEVPQASFALVSPDGWLWMDTSSGDLEMLAALAEATDPERAPSLSPLLTHWPPEIPMPSLFAMAPLGPGSELESCTVTASPLSGDSIDERMTRDAASTAAEPGWSVTGPLLLELPAGPAGRLDSVATLASPTGAADIAGSGYYLAGETQEYVLFCFAPDPPADRWLSIAASLELLPAPER